jgi:hypothetical protein
MDKKLVGLYPCVMRDFETIYSMLFWRRERFTGFSGGIGRFKQGFYRGNRGCKVPLFLGFVGSSFMLHATDIVV